MLFSVSLKSSSLRRVCSSKPLRINGHPITEPPLALLICVHDFLLVPGRAQHASFNQCAGAAFAADTLAIHFSANCLRGAYAAQRAAITRRFDSVRNATIVGPIEAQPLDPIRNFGQCQFYVASGSIWSTPCRPSQRHCQLDGWQWYCCRRFSYIFSHSTTSALH